MLKRVLRIFDTVLGW